MKKKDTRKDRQPPQDEALQENEAQREAAAGEPESDGQSQPAAGEASADETARSGASRGDDKQANARQSTENGADAEAQKGTETPAADSPAGSGDTPGDASGDASDDASGELAALPPPGSDDRGDGDGDDAAQTSDDSAHKRARVALLVAVLALLIGLLGLGGGYYLYQLDQRQRSDVQSALSESEAAWRSTADQLASDLASSTQAVRSAAEARVAAVAAEAQQAREAIVAQISDYDGRLQGLTESLSQTQEYALRGQRGWLLSEVDYLLRIAMQRVLLAGDMDSAAAALRAADGRLHELGDVNFLPVRQRLADEIAALRSADRPDIEGTVFELVRLGRRADELPLMGVLAFAEREAGAEPEAIDVMPEGAFWDALQNFIVVRRNDVEVDLSVSPSADQMSRAETLRLQLQAAQLAAMRRDQGGFTRYMDHALAYAQKEYEPEDPKVQRFVEDLAALGERRIVPQIDSLGDTLQQFKEARARYGEPRPDLDGTGGAEADGDAGGGESDTAADDSAAAAQSDETAQEMAQDTAQSMEEVQ